MLTLIYLYHKLCRAAILLIFFSLTACANGQKTDLVGVYKSKHYSKFALYCKSFVKFNRVSGNSLMLCDDSTYVYTTCAQISQGQWQRKSDSLFLYCDSIRFKKYILNHLLEFQKGTVCKSMPDVFKITKNGLVQQLKLKGGLVAENYLVKE